MDRREFYATKSPAPVYETVSFSHPAFDATFRLLSNKFEAVTLGGHSYTPAPMTIKTPSNKGGERPRLTLAFPRQVVGREFKRQLALLKASGSREPIAVTYAAWLGDTDAPKVTWNLYVADEGGVSFSTGSVQVEATLDNPLRRAVAPIYTPEVFTGLETL